MATRRRGCVPESGRDEPAFSGKRGGGSGGEVGTDLRAGQQCRIIRDGQLIKYKDGAVVGTMSDDHFESVIGVNLRGVFTCTRAISPVMIQGGGGVILNASSVVGIYGNFGQTNYVVSRRA